MKAFTLLTAALLLVAITAAPNPDPNPNLNAILDIIEKMHHNGTQDYVECLSNLTEGPKMCRHPFFCKVHDILETRELENKKTPEKNSEKEILRNLAQHLHSHNVTCSRVLKNVTTSTTTVPMPQFWKEVKRCIRHRNIEKS